jgi:hypothetical protein
MVIPNAKYAEKISDFVGINRRYRSSVDNIVGVFYIESVRIGGYMTQHYIEANDNKVECIFALCQYFNAIGKHVFVVTGNLDVSIGDEGLTKYGKVKIIHLRKKWISAADKQWLINKLGELKFIRNKSLNYQQGIRRH